MHIKIHKFHCMGSPSVGCTKAQNQARTDYVSPVPGVRLQSDFQFRISLYVQCMPGF